MSALFPPQPTRHDVAILGGGAAGLTLAIELKRARPSLEVAVVERHHHPVPETTHKVGESTVELASHYLRDVLGLGHHLEERQLDKYGLRMFFSYGDNSDITRRVELGHASCPPAGVGTYQVDRGRLENALGDRVAELGVTFLTGHRVLDLELDSAGDHQIRTVADDGSRRQLVARWVIDATGRASLLKRRLGLAQDVDHEANAVWFRIDHPLDIDRWSDDPAWHGRIREGRRELSTNHLMGPGYWVWLIRLSSGGVSIGIVTDPRLHPFEQMNRFEHAIDWLRRYEPQCAAAIEPHADRLQDFRIMKDFSYSAERVFSDQRWCLAGEAGVFLDPLYSPGLDLIALSNGLITDLVTRDHDGEDIEDRVAIHNQVFLLITDGWLGIYRDQYHLLGNARVSLAKVIWDTAAYWAVPGFLYFQDAIRDLAEHPAIVTGLARFSNAGDLMQRLFREWHEVDDAPRADSFVSFYDFPFMRDLHIGMTADLGGDELEETFATNVGLIERLSGHLIRTLIDEFADSDDQAKRARAERWLGDPDLARLIDAAEPDRLTHPIGDGWFTLTPPQAEAGAG